MAQHQKSRRTSSVKCWILVSKAVTECSADRTARALESLSFFNSDSSARSEAQLAFVSVSSVFKV